MLPVFVDSGASPSYPNGQIFPSSQLCSSHNNTNDNDIVRFSCFSTTMDPTFGVSSPSWGPSKPAAGLSRPPRLAKLRKPLAGHRPNLSRSVFQQSIGSAGLEDPGTDSPRIDPGSSSSKPASDPSQRNSGLGFVFGSNDGGQTIHGSGSKSGLSSDAVINANVRTSEVIDEMGRLRIESEKGYSNGMNVKIGTSIGGTNANIPLSGGDHSLQGVHDSLASQLPDEMRRLRIENQHFSKLYAGNIEELPNKMKKLNMKDYQQDDAKKFEFGRSDDNPLGGSSDTGLPDKRRSLNIDDSSYTHLNEKTDDASCEGQKMFMFKGIGNANKTVDLNKPIQSSYPPFKTGASLGGSAAETMHKMKPENLGDGNLSNISGPLNSGLTFQAGSESEYGGARMRASLDHESNSSSFLLFASGGIHFKPAGFVPETSSMDGAEKQGEFRFTSKLDTMAARHLELKTPDPKGNLVFGLSKKIETKRELTKDTGLKKKKGRWKKPVPVSLKFGQDVVFQENMQENAESHEQYSPMEVSPYEETIASNSFSRETSVASEESFHVDDNNFSSEADPNVSNDIADEGIVSATENLCINEFDVKGFEIQDKESAYPVDECIRVEGPEEDAVSWAETASFKSATDELECSTDSFTTAADAEVSTSSSIERQDSDGATRFRCNTTLRDSVQTSFIFASPCSALSESSVSPRLQKKKSRNRVGQDSHSYTSGVRVLHASTHLPGFQVSGSSLSSPEHGEKGLLSQRKDMPQQVKELATKQDSSTIASIVAQESCEKWRLRGNQAYAKGDFSQAEDCYTQGLNSVSQNETSRSCLQALMLCYSNRAATRMSLGRLKEALEDCMRAAALDPYFLRVQVRAASCYLALGEVENARLHFMKCLQAGSDVCADRKLLVEATDGLEKAKKVAECVKQAAELLERRTSGDIDCAVSVIAEGLKISYYSVRLIQMKMDALLMLKKYEELIDACEKILDSSGSNSLMFNVDNYPVKFQGSNLKGAPSFRVWCWSLILKSYFYLGRLEEALVVLKKQEESVSLLEQSEGKTLESMIPLIGTIRELFHHKAAGNEAYQSGKHAEAVEHYSAAIRCSVESRPFAAVCFCNRAAAYRALGQIVDALADCSLAIALDGNYFKAISRRATLYETIRDYGQAVADLQKLVSLLTEEADKKTNQSGTSDKMSCVNELRQARLKLSEMEEAARKEIPLNMYIILGVDSSSASSEIKKAYRKAALKYHPDKAGQSLARNENTDDGIWKEIAEEVHKDADRLFKMIGEAYAVLSDPTKRSRYDLEEEMRNAPNTGKTSNTSNIYSDLHSYSFERSGSRRQWQEVRRSYGTSTEGWEGNRYNWY